MGARAWLWLVLASTTPACAVGASAPEPPRVERLYVSRCGSCHMRVERGSRTHEELTRAFARHRRRLRLTSEEWAQMADYLSAPAAP
jgi:hypothetical protein